MPCFPTRPSAGSSWAARRVARPATPACAVTFRSWGCAPGVGRSRSPSSIDSLPSPPARPPLWAARSKALAGRRSRCSSRPTSSIARSSGAGGERGAALSAVTKWRVALSFLIWNSLPDQMLMDQAANGMLATADGIRTAATRMLDDDSRAVNRSGPSPRSTCASTGSRTQAKDPALSPSTRPEPSGRHGARHARYLGCAGVRRSGERARPVHDHQGRRELGSGEALRPRYDWADVDHFPDASLPADGPRAGILSKAGLLVAVREPAVGLAHACAASSSAKP